MLALQIFLLLAGLVLLVKGADWFVEGSAGLARRCRIPTLVIGLTVVAFGTSAPELAVSVTSAIRHSTDIAIGNVVGSNISNILLILGVSALICPLPVQKSSLLLDFPALLAASALLLCLGYRNGALNWWDGIILLAVFAAYMALLLSYSLRRQRAQLSAGVPLSEMQEKEEAPQKKLWVLLLLLAVGLAMVVGGGTLLVNSAVWLAEKAGVSERIVGLTIVAVGTSLPELVTSAVAAVKKETDIAVGNVLGSNIFNVFMVAGLSSLVYPLAFTSGNLIDAIVALAAALLLLGLALLPGHSIRRWGGGVLLAGFAAYYVYLFAFAL